MKFYATLDMAQLRDKATEMLSPDRLIQDAVANCQLALQCSWLTRPQLLSSLPQVDLFPMKP